MIENKKQKKFSLNAFFESMSEKQKKITIAFMMIVILIFFILYMFKFIFNDQQGMVGNNEKISKAEYFGKTANAVLSPLKKIDFDNIYTAFGLYKDNAELQSNDYSTDTVLLKSVLERVNTIERKKQDKVNESEL